VQEEEWCSDNVRQRQITPTMCWKKPHRVSGKWQLIQWHGTLEYCVPHALRITKTLTFVRDKIRAPGPRSGGLEDGGNFDASPVNRQRHHGGRLQTPITVAHEVADRVLQEEGVPEIMFGKIAASLAQNRLCT
jgi:hypothetical protein